MFWTIILPAITIGIQFVEIFHHHSLLMWCIRILAIVNIISYSYDKNWFCAGCWTFTATLYWLMLILFNK